jgi:sodium-dependent dicarboxylate transporter 2/3/5
MTGIVSNKIIAQSYGHWLILLLLSGFILSVAMEKSGVHRRMAYGIIRFVGGDQPKRIIFGIMLTCAFLSAWISNTATCLMMLPIALALCHSWKEKETRALLLSLAYSASIGGMATPIGTPPNVVLMGVYEESTGNSIAFLDWMMIGTPIAIIMLLATWVYLTRGLSESIPLQLQTKEKQEAPKATSPLSKYEKRILIVFVGTALAWMTRKQPFGGWTGILDIQTIGDDTVGLAAVVLLFLIPSGMENNKRLIEWEDAKNIPWGLLLLFGGGIAIAKAFGASGLSHAIGTQLASVSMLPILLMMGAICLLVTFLTEITSNTATTTLLMPILAATAIATDIDPLLLMIPAALSASCAFMLPVATAPNAIVFGTGKITTNAMARTGFGINLMGTLVISFFCWLMLSS